MAINLNYQGKQDNGSNECGAYALTACLLALGKLPLDTRSHRPEQTLLYQIVDEYYPAFAALMAEQGKELPGYVGF